MSQFSSQSRDPSDDGNIVLQNFKLQICRSFPRSSFLFPFFSLWQLCTLEQRMEPRYEATSLNLFSSISCSILVSSTTSSSRWPYKETAGVAIIREKDVFQLLNVQRMISIMCECKQLQKNVPKLDCEWKARRFVVHQTFRSCTL